jgi:hypothetical protein
MLSSGLLMVHDSSTGGEHNVTKLTGWEKLDDPLLEITELYVVSWVDATSLVEASVQLNDNLSVTVIINLLEFSNVP